MKPLFLQLSLVSHMFSRLFGRKHTSAFESASLSDCVLNEAIFAYVKTFPQKERLAEFIASRGLTQHAATIAASLGKVVCDTQEYLYAQADGVRWSKSFENDLFSYVQHQNPWLTVDGFKPLLGFGGWLCWHEGLMHSNATPWPL
jgi:hypothetical protein